MTNADTDQSVTDSTTAADETTFIVESTDGPIDIETRVTASDRTEAIRQFVDDATHHMPDNIEKDSQIITHTTMGSCPIQFTIDTDELVAYPADGEETTF